MLPHPSTPRERSGRENRHRNAAPSPDVAHREDGDDHVCPYFRHRRPVRACRGRVLRGSTAAPPAGTPASSPLASSPDSPTSSTVIGSGDQSASPPRLNASTSITGLVTYADGRPVIGAVVSLSTETALAIPEIGVLTGLMDATPGLRSRPRGTRSRSR